MEIAKIRGEPRQPGSRHANERIRRRGLIPGVIYGHGQPPETVSLSYHDLDLALERATHVIELDAQGQKSLYLIKDVQYDHLQKDPIHVDLMRVDRNERVEVKVPLRFKGEPRGTHEGGELIHIVTDLELECPLLEIPEVVYHNIRELGLNAALYIKDLELPAGVKSLHEPEEMVAIVRPKRGVEGEELEGAVPAEGTAEPEVIGKGKEDTAGAGGE